MGRKTIDVETVRIWVNTGLSAPDSLHRFKPGTTPDHAFRLGIASVLEQILHNTGNYHGFNYQASEFLPAEEQTEGNVLQPDYDESRRIYH